MALAHPELAPPRHPLERLPEEWEARLRAWGEPRYRALQVFRWIHARGVWDPDEMTDLPKRLRARLREEALGLPMQVAKAHPSSDGTRKLLVRMEDGSEVETVLIPQLVKADPDVDEDDRREDLAAGRVPGRVVTQCISSQVGCAMGCVFCASGVAGLKRHMSAAEILAQVLLGRNELEGEERIRNVVLMGMGEPLHNYDAVARALALLTHPEGIALSSRRVTLSSSGLVPAIDRLGRDFDGKVALAISLHATTDEQRSSIMPINRKHGLAELMACLRRYPLPKRRRITIEYTLIRGVNDSPADAKRMLRMLEGIPVKINLIPMNPISGSPLEAPDMAAVTSFRERLFKGGISTFIRKQRGDDVAAACGQLAFKGEGRRRRKRLPLSPEVDEAEVDAGG